MKEITIYECEDGSRFDNRKEAAKYDEVLEKVKQIMAPIGEPVTESYSAKQRDKDAVEAAVKDFMQLCAWCIPDWSDTFGKVNELEDLQRYIVGRVLDDYNNDWECLRKAYFRLSCISPTSYIEYEQPYWTSHEEEYQEELLRHNKQKQHNTMNDAICLMCDKMKTESVKDEFTDSVVIEFYRCPNGIVNPVDTACAEFSPKEKYAKLLKNPEKK